MVLAVVVAVLAVLAQMQLRLVQQTQAVLAAQEHRQASQAHR
jgi:hypothetical protein